MKLATWLTIDIALILFWDYVLPQDCVKWALPIIICVLAVMTGIFGGKRYD